MRITKADMIWEEDLKALQEAQQEAHAARQSMGPDSGAPALLFQSHHEQDSMILLWDD